MQRHQHRSRLIGWSKWLTWSTCGGGRKWSWPLFSTFLCALHCFLTTLRIPRKRFFLLAARCHNSSLKDYILTGKPFPVGKPLPFPVVLWKQLMKEVEIYTSFSRKIFRKMFTPFCMLYLRWSLFLRLWKLAANPQGNYVQNCFDHN